MKILVKYPTRQRPHFFLKNIREYSRSAYNNDNITYLVSYDADDISMTEDVLREARMYIPDILLVCGTSKSKIDACNRDIELVKDWDIVLVISDDMWVQCNGWDTKIIEQMKLNYPDTDGCLWFHDGTTQKIISMLSCIGRKYYDKFGYIYYPKYKSFFSDNEYTEIALADNKITFIDEVIIKNEHPDWKGAIVNKDALYIANDKNWKHDEDLYNLRKLNGFMPR